MPKIVSLLLLLFQLCRSQIDISTFLNPGGGSYHKDDSYHRDVDTLLGITTRDQSFLSYNDGITSLQHRMDSANTIWNGTLTFNSAPSNSLPTFSKTFKKQVATSTASEVYITSVFDSKTLKVVVVSYTVGNPTPFNAYVAIDTLIDSDSTVVFLDATHHNGEIFLLCKTGTPGIFKIKRYTLPTVPNTMVSTSSDSTANLVSTWGTNPIDDDMAAIRVGRCNQADVYLTAVIFNRVSGALYTAWTTTRFSRSFYFYSGFLDTANTVYTPMLQQLSSLITAYPSYYYITDMAFYLGPSREYRLYVSVAYSSSSPGYYTVYWLTKSSTDSPTFAVNNDLKVILQYSFGTYYFELSQNAPVLRGFTKPTAQVALFTFSLSTNPADTYGGVPSMYWNYENQPGVPRVEECDGYTNTDSTPFQVRFCSNYYEDTFDGKPQTVVDSPYVENTNFYRYGRIQKFGRLQGAFMALPLSTENSPVMMGIFVERSFVYVYQMGGALSTSTKKKEYILIKPSRYTPLTAATPYPYVSRGLSIVNNLNLYTNVIYFNSGSAIAYSNSAQNLKFYVSGLLDNLQITTPGAFPWKIAGPLNSYIPLVLDQTKLSGNNFRWSVGLPTDTGIERLIFKDNMALMELTATGGNTPLSLSGIEVYPTGSVVWTRSGSTVSAYLCDQRRAEEKPLSALSVAEGLYGVIKMNCTLQGTITTAVAAATYYKHFNYFFGLSSLILKNGNDYMIISSRLGSSFIRTITISYNLIDLYPYGDSTSGRAFLAVLYTNSSAPTLNWLNMLEVKNDGSSMIIVGLDPSSSSYLENPAQILLVTSPTTIYLLDFKGVHYRVTILSSSLSGSGNLAFSPTNAIVFNRPDLEVGTTLFTLRGCLFPNMAFLYYYPGSNVARLSTPLTGTTASDLSTYSLALGELSFTAITSITCNYWSSTFAVIGRNSSSTLVAVYDITNFAWMDKRLKALANIKSSLANTPTFSAYPDKGAWYLSGSTGTSAYLRVLNESSAALLVKPLTDPISFTLYLDNNVATTKSIVISGKTYPTSTLSQGTISVFSKPTLEARQTQVLRLEDLISFNGHVLSIDMTAPLSGDQSLFRFTPRINFEKVLNNNQFIPFRRVLPEKRRVLQTSSTDPVAPTLIKTRDGITIVMFDWGSPAKTRMVVYANTETNTKTLDTVVSTSDSLAQCTGFDFRFQPPLNIHVFLVCVDNYIRYTLVALDSSIPVTVFKRTQVISFNSPINSPKISVAAHTNFDQYLIVVYSENASEGVLLFGLKLSDSSSSIPIGNLAIWPSTNYKQLSGTSGSQPKVVSNFVELNFGSSVLGCIAVTDTTTANIQYKVYCVDTQMTQTSTPLPVTSYQTISLTASMKAPSSIMSLSCAKASNSSTESSIFCDAITYDSYIYESKISVNLDLAGIRVDKSPTGVDVSNIYERYGDTIGWTLSSTFEYIATTGQSQLERFNRVMLYRRISAGGSKYTNYSVDIVSLLGLGRESSMVPVSLYYHPLDGLPRLLVYDYSMRFYGRIYKITSQTVEMLGAGLYELLRLQNTDFYVNRNLTSVWRTPFSSVLFSQTAPNRDVRDISENRWFVDNIWWWLLGFFCFLLVMSPLFIYYFRRERLKKFLGGGGE